MIGDLVCRRVTILKIIDERESGAVGPIYCELGFRS